MSNSHGRIVFFFPVFLCLATCSEDAGQSQGAFCETTADCMVGLVCRQNTCMKPGEGACDPPCNPDGETCFDDQCVVVVDPDDKDADGSPAAEDCDDFDRSVYPGAVEHCDGVDNNCDGQTDEGCPACRDGSSRECGDEVGECTLGTMSCVDGRWQPCSGAGPEPEKCDGLDNDCDGLVDEVCPCHEGEELACSTDTGACSAGFQKCEEGAWGECINGILPRPERCDGVDDDCDGLVDDGFDVGGDCLEPGECGAGFFECAGELQVRCSTAPGGSQDGSGPELCNQLDDDCDGDTDEDFAEVGTACDGPDSDLCANGIWACTGDQTGMECGAEVLTDIEEICNRLDDDCDGLTDEDFGVGEECIGLGGCGEGVGRIECAGEHNVRCSTNPGGSDFVPRPEACDGVDNDCDGETDEDFPELGDWCDGGDSDQCKNGHYTCNYDGSGTECMNETIEDIKEKCNDLDDDCDGLTDEDYFDLGLGTACNPNGDACVGEVVCDPEDQYNVKCHDPLGELEKCDGEDNNCNFEIDDVDLDGDGFYGCDYWKTTDLARWDCCDSIAEVNRENNDWHDSYYTCGTTNSWDWNCDQKAEHRWTSIYIPCIMSGWFFVDTACGQTKLWYSVGLFCVTTMTERKQECR